MDNFADFNLNVAKPGTKATGASRPELTVTPTVNKFNLNALASKKMGLENGDHITILTKSDPESVNDMYFICKGIGAGNQAKLASVNKVSGVGRALNFNYSGIWSKMLQMDTEAVEASGETLVEKDLAVKSVTDADNVSYTALRKIHFEIGDPITVEINDEAVEVFPLQDAKIEDYNPRRRGEE